MFIRVQAFGKKQKSEGRKPGGISPMFKCYYFFLYIHVNNFSSKSGYRGWVGMWEWDTSRTLYSQFMTLPYWCLQSNVQIFGAKIMSLIFWGQIFVFKYCRIFAVRFIRAYQDDFKTGQIFQSLSMLFQ